MMLTAPAIIKRMAAKSDRPAPRTFIATPVFGSQPSLSEGAAGRNGAYLRVRVVPAALVPHRHAPLPPLPIRCRLASLVAIDAPEPPCHNGPIVSRGDDGR